MKIAIIGTGFVATTLAGSWSTRGHTITLGSRNPDVRSADVGFVVESVANAVAGADLVVNATPGIHSVAILGAIPAELFRGKVLLDVAAAYTPDYTLVYPQSSLAEALQAALPLAQVVKSLNTADMAVFVSPTSIGESTVFISGDDRAAKEVVESLIMDLGWQASDIVDLGGIASARATEHFLYMFLELRRFNDGPMFNIRVVR